MIRPVAHIAARVFYTCRMPARTSSTLTVPATCAPRRQADSFYSQLLIRARWSIANHSTLRARLADRAKARALQPSYSGGYGQTYLSTWLSATGRRAAGRGDIAANRRLAGLGDFAADRHSRPVLADRRATVRGPTAATGVRPGEAPPPQTGVLSGAATSPRTDACPGTAPPLARAPPPLNGARPDAVTWPDRLQLPVVPINTHSPLNSAL